MKWLAIAAWSWFLVIIAVMWSPIDNIGGLDLRNLWVQVAAFSIGSALFATTGAVSIFGTGVTLKGRGVALAYLPSVRRHCLRIAMLMILFSAILEVGKILVPYRRFRIERFFENSTTILIVCLVVYILSSIIMRAIFVRRILEAHLRQSSRSLREETRYSGILRDYVQTAYAVISAPGIEAKERCEKVGALLNAALGEHFPGHDDSTLEMSLGPRRKVPQPYRAFDEQLEHPPSAVAGHGESGAE